MKNMMEELYLTLSEQAENDPQYHSKWRSAGEAALAVLEELEARRNSAHEQAVFRLALGLGMELGRMCVN